MCNGNCDIAHELAVLSQDLGLAFFCSCYIRSHWQLIPTTWVQCYKWSLCSNPLQWVPVAAEQCHVPFMKERKPVCMPQSQSQQTQNSMSVGKAFARWLFINHIRWVDSHTASVPISIMLTDETANLLNEQLKQIAAADVRQQPKNRSQQALYYPALW